MNKPNDPNGNRTRDLPACSAVPQTNCATPCPGFQLMGPVNACTAVRCTEAGTTVGVQSRSEHRGRLCRVRPRASVKWLTYASAATCMCRYTYEVRVEFPEIVSLFQGALTFFCAEDPFENLKPAGPCSEKCI